MKRALTLCLLILTVAACGAPPTVSTADTAQTILTSPSDQRSYRYQKFENGLRVLIVSDPAADKAAAALRVEVGSAHNPRQRQGLAHFLEHMLFLGTSKYPNAGEYQAFISEHGGSHNAFTALDHTTYFFDIDPTQYDLALDRFSQFFIAPLFDREFVEREMNAVHSEYSKGLKDDGRRGWDVFSEVVDPGHPFATLAVGNLDTLQGGETDIREDLLKFYAKYYTAEEMTLVMVSSATLDEMEAYAQRFSKIPNTGAIEPLNVPPHMQKDRLPMQVSVVPVKEHRTLSLYFPIASAREQWPYKPYLILAHSWVMRGLAAYYPR